MTEANVSATRRRRVVWIAAVVALLVLIAAALLVLYARGGGPVPDALAFLRPRAADPLAPPTPAETVLRTLRLAGFDRASVGSAEGTVVVRVEMPATTSSRQVELSWQTALSAGAVAYPRARTVVAQLFAADGSPLLEVVTPAAAIRTAVERDDALALRSKSRFRYLPSAGGSQ